MVVVVEAIVSLSLLIYTVRAQPGQNSSLLEKKETRRRRRRSGQADNGRLLLRRSHNLRQTRSSSNPISRHRANGYRENTKIRSKRRNLSHTSSNSLEELWWGIHYIIVISHVKSRWCRSKLSSPEARARRLKYIQTLKVPVLVASWMIILDWNILRDVRWRLERFDSFNNAVHEPKQSAINGYVLSYQKARISNIS